jgi:hypothetical protein
MKAKPNLAEATTLVNLVNSMVFEDQAALASQAAA